VPLTADVNDGSASGAREEVLKTAIALFERHGARGTTIRMIGEVAHVNTQLIYYYFGDKGGLLRAALKSEGTRISALLSKNKSDTGSVRQRLSEFICGAST
jgi:AcrR family transcriptional regulator